jgi:hypothetical protein
LIVRVEDEVVGFVARLRKQDVESWVLLMGVEDVVVGSGEDLPFAPVKFRLAVFTCI